MNEADRIVEVTNGRFPNRVITYDPETGVVTIPNLNVRSDGNIVG